MFLCSLLWLTCTVSGEHFAKHTVYTVSLAGGGGREGGGGLGFQLTVLSSVLLMQISVH